MTKDEIMRQARKENRANLTEIESKELIKSAGIPVVETKLARTKAEAVSLSKKMGFPVALKIVSPDVVHKSDSGGVKLGLVNAVQVGKAYSEIISAIKKHYPRAKIEGYPLLQGYRGQEPADIPFLEALIIKVSDFIDKNPEIKELDLNPVFAYKHGAVAVDARVILEPAS